MDQKESKRIEEILDAIMKVARGDFHVQVNISDRFDDLDALAMGFNLMIDDIRDKYIVKKENEQIKELNRQLEIAKNKAEESDLLKSAFLANMSHEIRTPMNGILGFTDLLKMPGLSEEKRMKYLGIIEQSGQRLLSLINDIINLSKIEAGQHDLGYSKVNINHLTQFVHDSLKLEAQNKGLEFNFVNGLSDDMALIRTDYEKVWGILTNLVKNAIKYTDEGRINVSYELEKGMLRFDVADTGIGVSKHQQKKIFERFIRSDVVSKQARQGAGLGLSIAQAYVELLGGKIWMESEEHKGSVFHFTIPYQAESFGSENENRQAATRKDQLPGISPLNILVVEDDDISYELISIELDSVTKTIVRAKNGFEALELYHKHPDTDLIMMDLQLPGLDGYEVTRRIRETDPSIVIIAETAYGLEGDREKALEAGCTDYLSKPINHAVLFSLLEKYFLK